MMAVTFWFLIIGALFYLMLQKNGGCCGGHGEHEARHGSSGKRQVTASNKDSTGHDSENEKILYAP